MADETLATAAVEIIADFDRFDPEPEIRRRLNEAVQAASKDAEREWKKGGSRSGKAFADAAGKAAAANNFEQVRSQILKLEQAAIKAGDSQADAAGRVREAEARLAQIRASGKARADQLVAAEEALARAQRASAAAGRASALIADELNAARGRLAAAAQSQGQRTGESFLEGLQRSVRRGSRSSGEDAGGFFANAFQGAAARALGTGLVQTFAALGATLATSVSPLATIFGGATAAIVAIAGALGQASGAALAFGGVLGSLGLAVGTLTIGFSGLDDAIKAQSAALAELNTEGAVSEATQKKLDAALKNLAPNAQAVVKQLGAMAPAWRAVQQTVQNNLFAGVSTALANLGNRFLPILQKQLGTAASTLSKFATGLADFLAAPAQANQINTIFTSLNVILGKLLTGVKPLVSAFLTLFTASLPFAERLADVLVGLANQFKAFVDQAVESGRFQEFMENAFEAASNLFGLLGNLGKILGSVFGAGAGAGTSLLGVLEELTGDLAAFLKSAEGQSALASFFNLIGEAGKALTGIFSTLGPAVSGIAAVFTALRPVLQQLGAALQPVIQSFSEMIGSTLKQLARILADLLTGLTPLITALGTGLVQVLGAVLQAIIPILPAIVQFATTLAANIVPVVNQLAPVLVQLATSLGQVLLALVPILPALIPLIPPLAQLSIAAVQLVAALVPLITLFAQLASVTVGQVAEGLAAITPFLINIVEGMIQITNATTQVISAIVSFVGQAVALFNQLRTSGTSSFAGLASAVLAIVLGLAGRVLSAFAQLVSGALGQLRSFLGSAVAVAGQIASGILSAIRNGLAGLAGVFRSAFSAARSAVAGAMQSILDTVEGFISRISGAISRIGGLISKIPHPGIPGIPGLANGGLVTKPSLVTFAEDGPEVAIPLTKPRRRDELLDRYFGGWADQRAFGNGTGPYGGKRTEVHMPINVAGLTPDQLTDFIDRKLTSRFGAYVGVDTSRGTV